MSKERLLELCVLIEDHEGTGALTEDDAVELASLVREAFSQLEALQQSEGRAWDSAIDHHQSETATLRTQLEAVKVDAEIFRHIIADTEALECSQRVGTLDAAYIKHAEDVWVVEGPDDNACRGVTLLEAFRLAYNAEARARASRAQQGGE